MQDLSRTFPGHPWLDTKERHAALRRVLVAYSFRDSDVGYCQVCVLIKFVCACMHAASVPLLVQNLYLARSSLKYLSIN